MGELAIHLSAHGALLQHDHDMIGPLGRGAHMQTHQPLARMRGVERSTLYSFDRGPTRAQL